MNKKSLAALGAVAVLCVAAFAAVIVVKLLQKREAVSSQEALPAGSFVVARVDLARARRWSSWSAVRRFLEGDGADGGAGGDRVHREWRGLVERCGFDPLQRIDRITAAADRGVLQGRSQNDWLAHASGGATRAEIRRCIERVVQHAEGRITASTLESHEVLTLQSAQGDASPRTMQLHLRERGAMAAPAAYMPTALRVLSGQSPRLGSDQPVGRMLARLADRSVALVADVAGLRAQNQQTATEMINRLVRENPEVPNLGLAREVVTAGLGLRTENGSVIADLRAQMPSNDNARTFTAAVQALIQARRPQVLAAIGQVQAMTQLSRMIPGQSLDAEWREVDAAFTSARAVVEHGTQVTQDGDNVVLTVTVTAAQVTTFEAGVRAVQRVVGSRRGSTRREDRPYPELPTRGTPFPMPPLGRSPQP